VHLHNPILETVKDKGPEDRVVAVHGVAAAGIIFVSPFVVIQNIVDAVVQSPKGDGGPFVVAFGGMVEDDIEDYLYACGMEFPYHLLEICNLLTPAPRGGVVGGGGEEIDCAVTPVVGQGFSGTGVLLQKFVGIEFLDGQELQTGNPEFFEIWNLLNYTPVGSGSRGFSGWMFRESRQVCFVYYTVPKGVVERHVSLPVEIIIDDDAFGHQVALPLFPWAVMGQGFCIWIDEPKVGIKAVSPVGIKGAVNLVEIKLAGFQPHNVNMPDITGTILLRVKMKYLSRSGILHLIEQKQADGGGVSGKQVELDSPAGKDRPEGEGMPRFGGMLRHFPFLHLPVSILNRRRPCGKKKKKSERNVKTGSAGFKAFL
jgi:hypothetical protein